MTSIARSPLTVSIASTAWNIGTVAFSSEALALRSPTTRSGSAPSLRWNPRTNPSGCIFSTSLPRSLSAFVMPCDSSQSARSSPCHPQSLNALGHLGLNLHPRGTLAALGISPLILILPCFASGSGTGTADRSACVYGCLDSKMTLSVSPSSTTLPRYMTPSLSLTYLATAMSWVMKR